MSYIGQYRIVGKLADGGMGTVLVGEHRLLGRRAAIKTLLPSLSAQPELAERFFTEARATSAIADPGVVQIFDFGYHVDGTAYIVMELLEGEMLTDRLARCGRLTIAESLRIARQCAGSLSAAHAQGIVHRDLKPDNICLVRDPEASGGERPKLLDFGICKLRDSEVPSPTHSGTTIGTPGYMSPEQCRGAGGIDHRSDVYALGCVLFHMLTGRPPFEHEAPGDLMVAHMRDQPIKPSALVDGIPPELDELVMCCLEKSASDRYASMILLQAAIAPLEGGVVPQSPLTGIEPLRARPIGSSPPLVATTWDLPAAEPRPRRFRATALIGFTAVSLAIAGRMYGDGARSAAAITVPSDAGAGDALASDAAIDALAPLGDASSVPDVPLAVRRSSAPGLEPSAIRRERAPKIHRVTTQPAEDLYDTR